MKLQLFGCPYVLLQKEHPGLRHPHPRLRMEQHQFRIGRNRWCIRNVQWCSSIFGIIFNFFDGGANFAISAVGSVFGDLTTNSWDFSNINWTKALAIGTASAGLAVIGSRVAKTMINNTNRYFADLSLKTTVMNHPSANMIVRVHSVNKLIIAGEQVAIAGGIGAIIAKLLRKR